jgi:SAM-dependent methyltransferase
MWAAAFTEWYGADVVAVEPSAAMRARTRYRRTVAGHADAIPVRSGSMDGAWLSTVIHHVPDVPRCAAELRRVLRPGAPVLIRSVFPGRQDQVTLMRFFPEAAGVVDRYPSVAALRAAFAMAGFGFVALERVPQQTAPSLAAAVAALHRDAHTPLKLITDEQFEAGMTRIRAAARRETGPVIDSMDLLVLRSG